MSVQAMQMTCALVTVITFRLHKPNAKIRGADVLRPLHFFVGHRLLRALMMVFGKY